MSNKSVISPKIFLALWCISGLACNFSGRIGLSTRTPQRATESGILPAEIEPAGTAYPAITETAQSHTPLSKTFQVAYTSENNIYLWKDSVTKKLTTTGDAYLPMISPDGKLVAFQRPVDDYHLEIWVILTDGTGEHKLVSVADLDTLGAGLRDPSAMAIIPNSEYTWVPGSHKLAFTTQQIFQGPGTYLFEDLNLVNADTGEIISIFPQGSGGMFSFSPDGNMIAISQPDKIILANADGSDPQMVFNYDPVTTYSEYRFYAHPIWSPKSDYLMVAIPPADPLAKPTLPTALWRIEANGDPAQKVGSVKAVAFMEQAVSFSPDLERIAYLKETGKPDENLRELHLARQDGSDDQVYASDAPIFFQSWSQDSLQFLYTTGQNQSVWLGSLGGVPNSLGDSLTGVQSSEWINDSHFFYWLPKNDVLELFIGSVGGISTPIATTVNTRPYFSFIP